MSWSFAGLNSILAIQSLTKTHGDTKVGIARPEISADEVLSTLTQIFQMFRRMDTLGRFSKRNIFLTFCSFSVHQATSRKESTLKGMNLLLKE